MGIEQDTARQQKLTSFSGTHLYKPRSDHCRHDTTLPRSKRRQLNKLVKVENGFSRSCLGDAKLHEAISQIALQSTFSAPGSNSWQRRNKTITTEGSTGSDPASQQVRRSAAVIAITSRKPSTMIKLRQCANVEEGERKLVWRRHKSWSQRQEAERGVMHTQCPGSPASKHVCCRSAMITERPQSSVTRKGPTKAACSPKDASTPGSGGASRRKKPRKSRASEEARTRRVKKQMPNPFREHHRRGRAVDMRGVLNCCIVLAEGTRSTTTASAQST